MKWGAAIPHATTIRNLLGRRGEKNCEAERMQGIKFKFSISELSFFGCTVFRKLQPKALEGKLLGYLEGDKGYLVYVPNTRNVVAVRDLTIKESEVGSIPDNTEMPDLLDEGSQQLAISHPDDGLQNYGNKGTRVASNAMKEE